MRLLLFTMLLICTMALPVPANAPSAQGASKGIEEDLEPQVLPVEPYVFNWPARHIPLTNGVGMYELQSPEEGASPWEVTASEPWLLIQDTPFHIQKGESTYIYIGVNPDPASHFAPGNYPAEITFTLPDDGRFWKRQVVMQVVFDPNRATLIADYNGDWRIDLSEMLRLIQFYNSPGYYCRINTEDGYAPGIGTEHDCVPTSADYAPQDWRINLSELLRYIQFYNVGGYERNEDTADTEDGVRPAPFLW